MGEIPNPFFTTLLQDGSMLEMNSSMEPEDESVFTYANPYAQVFTQASQSATPHAQGFIQASQTAAEHAQVFTQTSQTPFEKGSAHKKRGGKFSIEEDRMLVSAYLNVSLDAVHGNEQKQKTYWKRVWEYFHENLPLAQRNETSLMCRWSTIQLSVNKFCASFAQIELKHQSGMTEEDKVSEAKDYYKEFHGGPFQFEHCWNILKYQPKWMGDVEKKKPKKKKSTQNQNSTVPSPSTPELVDLGECDATFEDLERPIGNKAMKLKRKKANEIPTSPLVGILTEMKEEQRSMANKKMDIIQQLHAQEQEKHQIDKERLREEKERNTIKKDMLRMEQLKEEERIMLMDTSALPRVQQEYYASRQMEILQEREKRFKSGDG